jgi:hypothetical protein
VIYVEKSLYTLAMEYWQATYKHWVSQEIFTFPWFFNIAFLLTLYIVWVKLADKKRLRELLLFGSLLAVASMLVDIIAVTIGLWEYRIRLFPLSPAPFPFDLTVVPIFYMLVMQYTSTWRGYLIGTVLAAVAFSFIVIPIYVWLGIKVFHNFSLFYMFIVVLIVTIAIKAIYNWIASIEARNSQDKNKKSL